MALDKINSYVKFIKGSVVAWEQLPIEQRKSDTLYFITEYATDESGKQLFDQPLNTSLYLGNVLVSDGKETTILPEELNLKLDHLIDVNTNYVLDDKMVLAYNSQLEQWIPQSIDTITADINDFTGATSTAGGAAGLVPAPAAGDEKKVLTGDGNWTELNIPDTTDLENQVSTLISGDANKSARAIAAEEVTKIVTGADEAYNTLKEISDWIISHPADVAEINSKITDIEKELYNEVPRVDENGDPVLDETTGEPIIDKVSKIGNLEEDLKEAQEKIIFTTTEVGQLETLLGAQKDDSGALIGLTAVDQIDDIFTALNPVLDESGNVTSFKELEKIEAFENILGVTEGENGEILIASAPIGNLEDLLLYQNSEDKPENLVEAINTLTDIMIWKSI